MTSQQQYYTPEQVAELETWFKERMERLPKQLRLSQSTTTNDLPFAITRLLAMAHRSENNICFTGYTNQLFLIRQKLEEQGL